MEEIATHSAPERIGPFSQAIRDGDRIYVSGQGPIDPETGAIVGNDVADQTRQVMANLETILEAGGSGLANVLRATVYLTDVDDYDVVNDVYESQLTEPYPARSAVEVSRLPVEIDVEIDVVARV